MNTETTKQEMRLSDLEKYKKEADNLIKHGEELMGALEHNDELIFKRDYDVWYSESLALIKILLPDKIEDFKGRYDHKGDRCIREYMIYDILPRSEKEEFTPNPLDYTSTEAVDYAISLFRNQLSILESAKRRFENSLFDIK
ncbi:MAG: hypothetical protein MSIBF_02275 [Candidatus Altiarchaeales archaeon IMC4]|nr:MAG: hypothetical protein MSIBF_02275 [Candidatus Altiarchaeales archaeon IMC4]